MDRNIFRTISSRVFTISYFKQFFGGNGGKATLLIIVLTLILCASFLYHHGNPILQKNKRLASQPDANKPPDNKTENLVYHPPINPSMHGKYFEEVNKTTLSNLLPVPVSVNRGNVEDFIFVSAVSSQFYPRLTLLVESIQTHFPTYKLVIYDMGLSAVQRKTMQKWCNVEVRKLHFEKYPPHVKILFSYAFKPIVVAEVLKEYEGSGVFWVDSSVRFRKGNITQIQDTAIRNNGVFTYFGGLHSVFSVTPPEMFQFLPFVRDATNERMLMATLVLIYKTKYVVDTILRWWVACALSRTCIYSHPSRHCDFKDNRWDKWYSCSRYDQSALTILIYNALPHKSVLSEIQRGPIYVIRGGSDGKISSCESNTTVPAGK